jgi:hypothetical protein
MLIPGRLQVDLATDPINRKVNASGSFCEKIRLRGGIEKKQVKSQKSTNTLL